MQKTINECVGCADGCHGCGRDRSPAIVCDSCGAVCTDLVFHEPDSNDDLCIICAVERPARTLKNWRKKKSLN